MQAQQPGHVVVQRHRHHQQQHCDATPLQAREPCFGHRAAGDTFENVNHEVTAIEHRQRQQVQHTEADADDGEELEKARRPLLPAPENPTPLAAMRHRLATPEGKGLYALRKQTPEPVFGIIKSVLGFRQFSLRGLEKVKGEWSLVTMAWNIKRMSALAWA